MDRNRLGAGGHRRLADGYDRPLWRISGYRIGAILHIAFLRHLPEMPPADFSSVPLWFPGGVLLKQVAPEMRFQVRIPRGAGVEYELEGEGSVELSAEQITLKKQSPDPAVWKNFRLIPSYARR